MALIQGEKLRGESKIRRIPVKVIGPAGVGVHARPAPDGLESAQDFDVLSGVGLAHSVVVPPARMG